MRSATRQWIFYALSCLVLACGIWIGRVEIPNEKADEISRIVALTKSIAEWRENHPKAAREFVACLSIYPDWIERPVEDINSCGPETEATVWLQNGKVVAVTTSSGMTSGHVYRNMDWYDFRPDGTLARFSHMYSSALYKEKEESVSLANEPLNDLQLSRGQSRTFFVEQFYSSAGELLQASKRQEDEPSYLSPAYRRVEELPFYSLLKKRMSKKLKEVPVI